LTSPATIRLHTSSTSHLSITSRAGSLNIHTSPPPPKPESKPTPPSKPEPRSTPPPISPYPTYTQQTTFTSPLPPQQNPYAIPAPYDPHLYNPYAEIQAKAERERRRSSLFREIAFVKELSEKLAPPPPPAPKLSPNPTRNETEKKLLEEMKEMKREIERRGEVDEKVRLAREEERERARRRFGGSMDEDRFHPSSYNHNGRAYESNYGIEGMATDFLAGVGMQALRSRRGPRSRSRERRSGPGRGNEMGGFIYIVDTDWGGRKGSSGGLGKIEDMVGRIHKRVVDVDFENDVDRVRFGRYARRV
jgi:hypothetical protein